MTTSVSPASFADMVTSTLYELNKGKFVFAGASLQKYVVMKRLLKENKIVQEGGRGIEQTLMLTHQNVARHCLPTDTDTASIPNVLTTMRVPWVHAETNWVILRQELLMNKGPARIVNEIKTRQLGARVSMAKELEEKFWSTTVPDSANVTDPWGIFYWLPSNATEGFNSGLPTGHTTKANVSPTIYPNFKGYTGTFNAYTDSSLLALLRRTARKINFETPASAEEMKKIGHAYVGYTGETNLNNLERLAEKRNDNMGAELMRYFGSVLFNKNRIEYVPYLDDNSNNPIFLLNHDTFFVYVLGGDYFHTTTYDPRPPQHNMVQTFEDLTYNYCFIDLRQNAHLYKV